MVAMPVRSKRSARELERRIAELERASAAKSRFIAALSHELRTPLNSVIGFAKLLRDGRVGPISGDQRECLEMLALSADHLAELVDDLLDLAQIEAERVTLTPLRIDPAAVVVECVESVRPLAEQHELELLADAPAIDPVLLDPRRLRQVLLNYLSNAIRFAPRGSTVRASLRIERGELVLEVADDGPGVQPRDRARVFEEFVQLDDRPRSGSGLGLAVTKLIVEAQGGAVGVRGVPGAGSVFFARIPVAPAHEPDLDRPRRLPAMSGAAAS